MKKTTLIPPKEYKQYIDWLNTPGLTIPAGKTSVQFYLECNHKGQRRMDEYG